MGTYKAGTGKYHRTLGHTVFELSNHLGNVLSVISDLKRGTTVSGGQITAYEAVIVSQTDYYPFGMGVESRTVVHGEYRFRFNTQEKTPEIGKHQFTAEFWQYDAKVARRSNVDPKPTSHSSNYKALGNNPLVHGDLLGDTVKVLVTKKNIGYTYIKLYSSSEIKANPKLKNKIALVPVYKTTVSNESGDSKDFLFTRYAVRRASKTDVTFDVKSNEKNIFSGFIKSRWGGVNNVLELRPLDWKSKTGAAAQTIEGMKSYRFKDRVAIQMHSLGASDGCLMCVNPNKVVAISSPEFFNIEGESQSEFMQTIMSQQKADKDAGFSDDVLIEVEKANYYLNNGSGQSDIKSIEYTESMLEYDKQQKQKKK